MLFTSLSLSEREAFLKALTAIARIDARRLAEEAKLYLTSEQLAGLAKFDFEVGNHTYTHVHCRHLQEDDLSREVAGNRTELELLSGRPVRSFSVPYGSSADFTPGLGRHLREAGYEAVFFSESVANGRQRDPFHLDRVSTRTADDATFFFEMEVMPRLRAIRNQFLRPVVPAEANSR